MLWFEFRRTRAFSRHSRCRVPADGLVLVMDRGQFRPGESVLVLGTGGVSIWALQIALHRPVESSSLRPATTNFIALRNSAHGERSTIERSSIGKRKCIASTTSKVVDHVIEVGGPGTLGKSWPAWLRRAHRTDRRADWLWIATSFTLSAAGKERNDERHLCWFPRVVPRLRAFLKRRKSSR